MIETLRKSSNSNEPIVDPARPERDRIHRATLWKIARSQDLRLRSVGCGEFNKDHSELPKILLAIISSSSLIALKSGLFNHASNSVEQKVIILSSPFCISGQR